MTGLPDLLSHFRQRVDRALDHWLPKATIEPQRLHEAMRYMTLGEGKRLRPILVYAAGRANGVAENLARLSGELQGMIGQFRY